MKENDNKGFWDRWAKRYDFAMSGDGRTYAQMVSRMKKILNKDMAVLELACGTGLPSVRLAGSVRLLEATDFSEEMIRQAKAKAHSSQAGIKTRRHPDSADFHGGWQSVRQAFGYIPG